MAKPDFEARRQRRFEKLGTSNPACLVCGFSDWRCLEAHHLADRGKDPTVVIICRNCHRILSDKQYDHPKHCHTEHPLIERIGRYLKGQSDLLAQLSTKMDELAMELIASASNDNFKVDQ